jgi:endonuclease YncB( thermonuclease family)
MSPKPVHKYSRRQIGQWVLGGGTGLLLAGPAKAEIATDPDFLAPGQLDRVSSGDSFILTDGRKVRLAGIEAPRLAQSKAAAQPLAALARAQLQDMLGDETLTFSDPAPDRFGRLRAQVHLGQSKQWVQGAMLSQGLARVRTWRDDFAKAAEMLRLEGEARSHKTGIWARAFYAIRDPEVASSAEGSFQLVEGEVVDASVTRKMVYLNFGPDWRRDFTAQADKKTARAFSSAGIELAGLSGARVRVRGTVRYSNGPMIWLNHSSQLEILPSR